jgi:hypothetical protein
MNKEDYMAKKADEFLEKVYQKIPLSKTKVDRIRKGMQIFLI